MGKPIIWSGANAKLINSGDLVDKYNNSLTDGGKVTYAWPNHQLNAPNDIGRPIRVVSGNQLALADNTTAANAEVAGFIYAIIDVDTVRVSFGGNCPAVGSNVLEGGGSVGGGNVYFLASTAGKVTATEPTTIGYISKPIAIGTATGSMFFINYRGSTVGSTNARTQINLSNNSTTNMQNCASYDAGSIEGWIYIDATTDYRFYFNAPFAEKGTNNDYFISPSYVGDTPPAGFSITINSSGQSIITLPNISGFVSATCTYSLNAPAVGTNFPLALDSANLTNSGITGLTGTAATTAVTTGSLKIGEYKVANPASAVSFGTAGANTNVATISLTAGLYILNGMLRIAMSSGTITAYFAGISTSSGAFDSVSHISGAGSTITSNTYVPTTVRYINVTTTTTLYLIGSINYSVAPTGNYAIESFIQAIRIA
jgi:hypothetical protein